MGITQMSRPFGLAVGLAFLVLPLLLSGSAATSNQPREIEHPLIVVLGFAGPAGETTIQSVGSALTNGLSGRCASARVQYVRAPTSDAQGRSSAVQNAMALRPTMLVAPTAGLALAAKAQAGRVPLIFASYLDPVRMGIVSREQARPENIAGVALDDRLLEKRLEILQEAFPSVSRVGVLVDRAWADGSGFEATLARYRERSGLQFFVVSEESASRVVAAMSKAKGSGVQAWVLPATQVSYQAEAAIIEYLRSERVPAIHATTQEVKAGALMAYAQEHSFVFDALAGLANRVCNGELAGTIPVERPRRFVLSIRSRYDLGDLRVASSVVVRADLIE